MWRGKGRNSTWYAGGAPSGALAHMVEYAKTGRARCRGTGSCGFNIEQADLRYGKEENSAYRNGTETVWKHWACVTPQILKTLKNKGLHNLQGLNLLREEDRERVRRDVAVGSISAVPILPPTTAVPAGPSGDSSGAGSSSAPVSSQPSQSSRTKGVKRKRAAADLDESDDVQPPVTPPQRSNNLPPATQIVAEQDIEEDNDDAEEDVEELYIAYPTKIVGVRYYTGLVAPGELVSVVREPTNRYDSNAVRILNAGGTQVGHISKAVAARLAPLMDQNRISVEGVMIDGNMSGRAAFDLSLTLNILGPSSPEARAQLEPSLYWATPGQRGFAAMRAQNQTGVPGTSLSPKKGRGGASTSQGPAHGPSGSGMFIPSQKAVELGRMMVGMAKVDDAARRTTILDALCGTDVLQLPEHDDPPPLAKGNLKTDLLKHQSQGLRWCIEHEHPLLPQTEDDKPVQFWQLRKNGLQSYYYNVATKTPQTQAPALGRGAIMADSMGLGKTLTMLGLILATLDDRPVDYTNATLIVVPLSVLSNWTTQIDEHVTDGLLTTCVYHGDGRNTSANQLAQHDVVLTTYEMVSRDWSGSKTAGGAGPAKKRAKNGGGLFGLKWKRVILDEGHNIRNPKTKTSQAIYDLDAERRWVVTGTPIINSPNDLGSILKFLRVCTPLDQHEYFNRLLSRPLSKGAPAAAEILKALMSSICLRRTKEMRDSEGNPLVPLPPVEVTVVRVSLSEPERKLYDDIFAEAQKRFSEFALGGRVQHAVTTEIPMAANVLSMLTRLRQLVLHPSLVPSGYLEELRTASGAGGHDAPMQPVDQEQLVDLQQRLLRAILDSEECSICFDILNNPRILPCSHYFCLDCIKEVISRQQKCPMDRGHVSDGDLIEPPPLPVDEDATDSEVDEDEPEDAPSSSKIQHLISLLRLMPASEKSLVFSQFTSFLDLIAVQLDKERIPYVRFDGSMPQKQRADVLSRFSVPLEDSGHTDPEDELPIQTRAGRLSAKGKGKAVAPMAPRRNAVVMLISLKAGALGLNLTVASRVFLMDPWWQSAIELQAIDRVNRIGQKRNVHVYQMVAEDTVEARVLAIQERKQLLVEQAFSGTRRNETHREKKEARLNDLVELFGTK